MKKSIVFCLLFLFFSAAQTYAQEKGGASQEQPAPQQQTKKVKPLPTCIDFSDVYGRVVLGVSEPSDADKEEMISLAAIMMGYVSAMQDIYGGYLVGMSSKDTEWTLLESVNKFCLEYPHLTFQRAVRSVPAVSQTMQALQDLEFNRCRNYIEQTKTAICISACKETKK